jgi:hypothetical protein
MVWPPSLHLSGLRYPIVTFSGKTPWYARVTMIWLMTFTRRRSHPGLACSRSWATPAGLALTLASQWLLGLPLAWLLGLHTSLRQPARAGSILEMALIRHLRPALAMLADPARLARSK